MSTIDLDGVTKVYPGGTTAVQGLDLAIEDGEFMVLVGPSGCGKTTALRMVAGLEAITHGTLRIDGEVVNDVPPKDRDIAMVFQNYALYPHMSVFDNMAFGLSLQKVPKAEIRTRVDEAARILDLGELLQRKPKALSGGQRQRVAMGRAIVRHPRAFLMDEPLSNLDAKLRVQTRAEIARLQARLGTTTIYVTHDQIEAMTMGDRVAVLRRGLLQQVDSPQRLYDHPANVFVAGFIGSPAMNLLEAELVRRDDHLVARLGADELLVPDALAAARPGLRAAAGRRVVLGIRPEDLEDAALDREAPAGARLRGQVELLEALGSDVIVHVSLEAAAADTEAQRELADDAGDDRGAAGTDQPEGRAELLARVNPRTRIAKGGPVELTVDTARLHFFDPDDGSVIDGGADR